MKTTVTETLPVLFERACHRFPGHTALRFTKVHLTYAQLAQRVEDWNKELTLLGFQPSERVLIAVNEPLDFIAIWFALWREGCIPVPLETSITSVELTRALDESRAHWFLTSIPTHLEALESVNTGTFSTQPAWAFARLDPEPVEKIAPDTALFFYTSGTTGTPKCVVFDHAAMAANVVSLVEVIELSENDVLLTPLSPMLPAALATAVLPTLCVGATLVLPSSPIPGQILRRIAATGASVFFAVPYLYELLSTAMTLRKKNVWSNVRLCLSSSAFLDNSLFDKFHGLTHLPIRSIYCSSEAGACTFNDATDLALIRDSVGRPLTGVELRVADVDGQAVSSGDEGQILARGSHAASGYFCRPDLQQQVFDGGWVKTGDLGAIDRTGYLRLSGRLSDTINVSGHLVNPREVEEVLLNHPAVAEALVYGLQDPQMGQVVAARVVTVDTEGLPDRDELLRLCTSTLSHYKVPRHIDFARKLPKSRYGKIERPTVNSSNRGRK
jgi:long-chain acyl-CoA synthetase